MRYLNLMVTLSQLILSLKIQFLSCSISRLNSDIKNRNNFFVSTIFWFQKTENNSINQADSGVIKILVQFPGNLIFKFLLNFRNCVGDTHMRGCFKLKITQWLYLVRLVILTTMSNRPLSEIYFNNKMAWVWTTLKACPLYTCITVYDCVQCVRRRVRSITSRILWDYS